AKHGDHIRPIVIESIEKMLWCSTSVYGSKLYTCENPQCTHAKYIQLSCKGRACSPCGTTATERWIAKQQHILPQCSWQHITFTLPEQFWPLFAANRQLLKSLSKLASKIVLGWAEKKGVEIGVFSALHTYGRQFNWNVHMHISVTAGGLCKKSGQWKPLYFKADVLRERWKEAVIAFFRKQHGRINLPQKFQHPLDWYNFLDGHSHRYWHVYLAKKSKHAKQTVNYLGRYLKKLPLSASRLRHMAANEKLNVRYLDHRTQSHKTLEIGAEALILLLIEHIPDKYFKMIRYYGFLANCKRKLLLPKVYAALGQKVAPAPKAPSFAARLKGYVGVDPFECILCGNRMIYSSFRHGSSIKKLVALRIQKKCLTPS
ncbi:MAG: IS91 family transposase, partial [Shewanella sp.]